MRWKEPGQRLGRSSTLVPRGPRPRPEAGACAIRSSIHPIRVDDFRLPGCWEAGALLMAGAHCPALCVEKDSEAAFGLRDVLGFVSDAHGER